MSRYLRAAVVLFAGLLLGSLPASPAASPAVFILPQGENENPLSSEEALSASHTQVIDPGAVDRPAFSVHAMQTTLLTRSDGVNGSTISRAPTSPPWPGESLEGSATTSTNRVTGTQQVSPSVWVSKAKTLGGSGVFADSGQRLGSNWSTGVALGDLNGDGDLDAMITNYRYAPMANRVWLNQGMGQFTDSGQALGEAESWGLALGDLDADGDLDGFVANWDGPNRVWLNDGTGHFHSTGQALGAADSRGVALGDLDGDGDLDAVVANAREDAVWRNNGSGHFSRAEVLERIGGSNDVALGDLNGDGSLDIFVAAVEGLRVWFNDGHGSFTGTGQVLGTSHNISVSLGDLNGNGHLDTFITKTNSRPHEVWLNDGTGSFTKTHQELGELTGRSTGALGDLNGNGHSDAFVGTRAMSSNTPSFCKVWLNDGQGNFSDSGQTLVPSRSMDIALGDLDLDGDLDAFSANSGGNRVWINLDPPLLALSKTGPPLGTVGEPVSYTLTTTNTGQLTATGLRITDTVPSGASHLRGGTHKDGVVNWTLASLEPGRTASVHFSVTAATPQTLVNDDYGVISDAGYSARGSVPVATVVTDVPISGLAATNDSPTPLGEPTELTASVSDGTDVSYTWRLDDQHTAQGASVVYSYPVGIHTALVTATNSVSEVTATTTVTVDQTIGGLVASNDGPTALGNITTLTAAVQAGSHVSYTWHLGDGNSAVGDVVQHNYSRAGLFTAVATAANSVSNESTNTLVTVDAPVEGLTAISDEPSRLGRATTLTATVEAGTSISYVWSLGDGSKATGSVVSYVYQAPGSYPIVVTATNWLNSTTASTNVQVLTAVYLPTVLRRWPPVPFTPHLNAIDNPGQDNRYTVTWQQAELADTYLLQEATDASFSHAETVYHGSNQLWTVPAPGNVPGAYYYRVKARNSWGDSAWSNVVQTTVTSSLPTPTPRPTATPVPCYARVRGVFPFGFDYRIDVIGSAYDVEVRVRWSDCSDGGWFERRYLINRVRKGFVEHIWVSSYGCRDVVAWVSDYRCP